MQDYPGPLAAIVNALKDKGVRLDITRFNDADITHLKQNVVILRGNAYKALHRALKRVPSRIS